MSFARMMRATQPPKCASGSTGPPVINHESNRWTNTTHTNAETLMDGLDVANFSGFNGNDAVISSVVGFPVRRLRGQTCVRIAQP